MSLSAPARRPSLLVTLEGRPMAAWKRALRFISFTGERVLALIPWRLAAFSPTCRPAAKEEDATADPMLEFGRGCCWEVS